MIYFEFHWNNQLETPFQQIKTSVKSNVTLTLHNPTFTTVTFSLTVTGCVPFQMNDEGKLDFTS